ncbi:MAG TPA: NmrA/HSCARG family protein [Candidatus Lokiarchaeia archaeon]|nr:NmrA/HSCARG family protein [Candidatus Lokiarchaeia archaeon]
MGIPEDQIVFVTGATGKQGGAVARALLKQGYHVHALSRDASSPGALALYELGIEIVQADLTDLGSLKNSMSGSDIVYAMTTPFGGVEAEVQQGLNLISVAQETGIKLFVMSSVASADQQTGIPHFDSKYQVEQALAESGLPYTIVAPVAFMENMFLPMALPNLKEGKIGMFLDAETSQQMIAVADIGEMVAAVIARGKEVYGRRYDIASDNLTGNKMAEILSSITGHSFEYVQNDPSEMAYTRFRQDTKPGFRQGADFNKMNEWMKNVGYSVDILALHEAFPEVPWHTFDSWVVEQNWATLLESE